MSDSGGGGDQPIRIVRVIARLNIGGPAIQAITLTRKLDELGYRTSLVRGVEGPDEGSMDHLASELGVKPERVPALRRDPGLHDLRALWSLMRIIRRERPQIVHTHAAKGGTLGRVATVLAFPSRRRRPVLVHTYHGHSLTGYFSSATATFYRGIERLLARITDRLIAVSDEVRDELVAMKVAPAAKFAVVPLGFDLSPFQVSAADRLRTRDAARADLGFAADARVLTLIARLVPIKRVDRFLRMAGRLDDDNARFLVVGDGELREALQRSPEAQRLGGRLSWAGFRRDMPAVLFASDLVVQTSDNEGTPVALIEAQAAGVPVVSTRVGGTASVVCDHRLLVERDDEAGLARAVQRLLDDPVAIEAAARSAQERVSARFTLDRLITDLDRVYREALEK